MIDATMYMISKTSAKDCDILREVNAQGCI
jgi:hypothetical protein